MLNNNSLLSPNSDHDDSIITETMVVAAIFPDLNGIWLLPYITSGKLKTKSPDKKPTEYDLTIIESAIEDGKISLDCLQLESYKDVPEEYLYNKEGEKIPSAIERDRRYEIVKVAMSDEDKLFYPMHGKGVIAKVAEQFKVTRHNVQRYLNEYFRGGRHINSLIPKTGRHSSSPKHGAKKVGAKRTTDIFGVNGKNVEPEDLEHIRYIAEKYYINKKEKSLQKCFTLLLDECYAETNGKILPNGGRVNTKHVHPNKQISIGQFYDWMPIALGMTRNDINAKRRQSAIHKSNFAGRTGEVAYYSKGPGHIFQLDSTEMDINIVSPHDRRVLLKKVTLYVIRDVYTRAFVSIHIASGKASWYEARLALLNAFRDKVAVAKECGLIIDKDDFIESGIPLILLVDNEEFANKISASVGRDLGLKVYFSRAYSGDDKGLVESSFHMLHAMMRNEELAGFQYQGLLGRNRKLPIDTAALTPREIQQILMIYAIYHNRYIWKEDYPLEQEAMNDGVKDICREYWEWGVKKRPYFLSQKPTRTLYLSLLEVGQLTVHKTHLLLQGKHLKYKCDDIRLNKIQDRIVGRSAKPVLTCRYIRSTVDKILIELDGKLVLGELHSNQQKFSGLSHDEFKDAWKYRNAIKEMHKHEISGVTSDTSILIKDINNKALKTKEYFIEEAQESPLLNTQTATQLQIQESYHVDNEMLDRVTETNGEENVGQTNQATIESDVIDQDSTESDVIDQNLNEEITPNSTDKSTDILTNILGEIGHG
jgi:hypothetical protein